MNSLVPHMRVVEAAEWLAEQEAYLTDLCIQVQQIPAPTGDEGARAAWVESYLRRLGLDDVMRDALHNVYARLPGQSRGPATLITAHTDTVFPAETDLSIRMDAQTHRLYGPGIGDNAAGVAGLLALGERLRELPPPPTDIWLVANSSEEGLGDLRGMRSVVDRLHDKLGACIVIEGTGLGRIVHSALGSRRFRIAVTAPGGHSWSDFGAESAIHVLVRLAADIAKLRPPLRPRTTFNIGRIAGGRSVNSIAQDAAMEVDLRSEENSQLQAIVEQTKAIVERYRTAKWQKAGVDVRVETIGDRPSGQIAADHPLVRAATRALNCVGLQGEANYRISSTDANIPLSRGIPAVCVGVTIGGNAHRLEEWIDPHLLPQGLQHLLLLTWWTSGWLAGEYS